MRSLPVVASSRPMAGISPRCTTWRIPTWRWATPPPGARGMRPGARGVPRAGGPAGAARHDGIRGPRPRRVARNPHARALKPDLENIEARIAEQLCFLGRSTEAIAAYDKAIERNPYDPQLRSNRLYFLNYFGLRDRQTLFAAHHRLVTFAQRPAPVQVSWFGYIGIRLASLDPVSVDRRPTRPARGVGGLLHREAVLHSEHCVFHSLRGEPVARLASSIDGARAAIARRTHALPAPGGPEPLVSEVRAARRAEAALGAAGIATRRWYLPTIDKHPAFRGIPHMAAPIADDIAARLGCPFYIGLDAAARHEVAAALARSVA